MAELTTFADRLKHFRNEKHFTQRELSIRTGIAEPTIRKYEAGKLNPKLETVQKFAFALELPVSDLYGWEYFDEIYHSDQIAISVKFLEMVEKTDPLTYDLLNSFWRLKPEGMRKVIDYVHDLTLIDQYIKSEE